MFYLKSNTRTITFCGIKWNKKQVPQHVIISPNVTRDFWVKVAMIPRPLLKPDAQRLARANIIVTHMILFKISNFPLKNMFTNVFYTLKIDHAIATLSWSMGNKPSTSGSENTRNWHWWQSFYMHHYSAYLLISYLLIIVIITALMAKVLSNSSIIMFHNYEN